MAHSNNTPLPASSIALRLASEAFIAGDAVSGTVDLTFNSSQQRDSGFDRVRVILRGSVDTKIVSGQPPFSKQVSSQVASILANGLVIWTRGASETPSQPHVLQLPFQLPLPDSLPPSFYFLRGSGAFISYAIEVLGERLTGPKGGRLARIQKMFKVSSAGHPSSLSIMDQLRTGFDGPWNTHVLEKKIRTGVWGPYSNVKAQLILPKFNGYPIFAKIPFRLDIITLTRPLKRTPVPVDKDNKPLFPVPPPPEEIEFCLDRHMKVRAHDEKDTVTETYALLGGLASKSHQHDLAVQIDAPEWVAAQEDGGKGCEEGMWRRAVHYSSHFTLKCPPTFATENLSCEYSLRLRIPFLGFMNDIKQCYPLTVLSDASPHLPTYTNSDGTSLSPPLGLPPVYREDDGDGQWKGTKG